MNRTWARVAVAALAMALAMAAAQTVRHWPGGALVWFQVAAALAGGALLVDVARGRAVSDWRLVGVVAPVTYLVLSTAPAAASLGLWPVARLAVSAVAAGAYVALAGPAAGRRGYAVGCACLGVSALFFTLWEPPPPTPVPIAKHLSGLESQILEALPGWTGKSGPLDPATEKVLGADEYLNMDLWSAGRVYQVRVFVTYNANAMTQVPHVPWVCMVQSGFKRVGEREDGVVIGSMAAKEIHPNVLEFRGGEGRESLRALMFHYFNVGRTYTSNRQVARFLATTGSQSEVGSYLSQTQVAIWLPAGSTEDPMDRASGAYRIGVTLLNILVPLLEREYYPDLSGAKGG